MKQILLTVLFSLIYNFSVSQSKTIYILPLGGISSDDVKIVQDQLSNFYGYKCLVLKRVQLSSDILSPSKTRYSADRILRKFNNDSNIIVLTNVDITTKKNGYNEWGVFGLGYRPGTTCVVSTHRIKKNVSNGIFKSRLEKISTHEVGHNLGLDHCTNDIHCLMNDAKGTISQVDREKIWLCNKCKKQINLK